MENRNENNTHNILHSTDESNVVKENLNLENLQKMSAALRNSENP